MDNNESSDEDAQEEVSSILTGELNEEQSDDSTCLSTDDDSQNISDVDLFSKPGKFTLDSGELQPGTPHWDATIETIQTSEQMLHVFLRIFQETMPSVGQFMDRIQCCMLEYEDKWNFSDDRYVNFKSVHKHTTQHITNFVTRLILAMSSEQFKHPRQSMRNTSIVRDCVEETTQNVSDVWEMLDEKKRKK
jgi:hypothetical protein